MVILLTDELLDGATKIEDVFIYYPNTGDVHTQTPYAKHL